MEAGSPAATAASLKAGQWIDSINGRVMKDMDPRVILGDIIAKAEATDGVVKLVVRDDEKGPARAVDIRIPVYAEHLQNTMYNNVWGGKGIGAYPYMAGGHMNAAGVHCLTFLLLAKECGVDVDEHTLQGSLRHFYRFAGHGNVSYGDGLPERSFVDNWYATDFDAAAAGWQKGHAPFGQNNGELTPLKENCTDPQCGCSIPPKTLWEKEVLMMRQTFNLPDLKEGHRYRLVLGGASHAFSGEGYSIYVNGNQFAQADGGFFKRGGLRGEILCSDWLSAFEKGKVSIWKSPGATTKSWCRYRNWTSGALSCSRAVTGKRKNKRESKNEHMHEKNFGMAGRGDCWSISG